MKGLGNGVLVRVAKVSVQISVRNAKCYVVDVGRQSVLNACILVIVVLSVDVEIVIQIHQFL